MNKMILLLIWCVFLSVEGVTFERVVSSLEEDIEPGTVFEFSLNPSELFYSDGYLYEIIFDGDILPKWISLNDSTYECSASVPFCWDAIVDGNYMYAICNDEATNGILGLRIFDSTDPANLVPLGVWVDVNGLNARYIDGDGDYVYLVTGCGSFCDTNDIGDFHVIDVSNKNLPTSIGTFRYNYGTSRPCFVYVFGDYAFIGYSSTLSIVNIETKSNPTFVSDTSLSFGSEEKKGVAFHSSGDYLYIPGDTIGGGIFIIDLTDKLNPSETEQSGNCISLAVKDDVLFCGYDEMLFSFKLVVYNISGDPLNPVSETEYPGDCCERLFWSEEYPDYLFCSKDSDSVVIFDVSGCPESEPVLYSEYSGVGVNGPGRIYVSSGVLVGLSDHENPGLVVWDISTLDSPRTATYKYGFEYINDIVGATETSVIYSAHSDSYVLMWDFSDLDEPSFISRLESPFSSSATSVAVTPDGKYLYVLTSSQLEIWDIQGENDVDPQYVSDLACDYLTRGVVWLDDSGDLFYLIGEEKFSYINASEDKTEPVLVSETEFASDTSFRDFSYDSENEVLFFTFLYSTFFPVSETFPCLSAYSVSVRESPTEIGGGLVQLPGENDHYDVVHIFDSGTYKLYVTERVESTYIYEFDGDTFTYLEEYGDYKLGYKCGFSDGRGVFFSDSDDYVREFDFRSDPLNPDATSLFQEEMGYLVEGCMVWNGMILVYRKSDYGKEIKSFQANNKVISCDISGSPELDCGDIFVSDIYAADLATEEMSGEAVSCTISIDSSSVTRCKDNEGNEIGDVGDCDETSNRMECSSCDDSTRTGFFCEDCVEGYGESGGSCFELDGSGAGRPSLDFVSFFKILSICTISF